MPVDHCVAKIKRNFNSSQSITSVKEEASIEQTSLKVKTIIHVLLIILNVNLLKRVHSRSLGFADLSDFI